MKNRLSFLPGDHIVLATTKSVSIYETKSTVEAITDSFSKSPHHQWCRWRVQGWKRTPKAFDVSKIRAKYLKIWANYLKIWANYLKIWANYLKIRAKLASNVVGLAPNQWRITRRIFLEVTPKGVWEEIFARKVARKLLREVWGNSGKIFSHPQKFACSYT